MKMVTVWPILCSAGISPDVRSSRPLTYTSSSRMESLLVAGPRFSVLAGLRSITSPRPVALSQHSCWWL